MDELTTKKAALQAELQKIDRAKKEYDNFLNNVNAILETRLESKKTKQQELD